MPYVKISELPAVTAPLSGDELLEVVQDATSKKATVNDIRGLHPVGYPMFIPGKMSDAQTIFAIIPCFPLTFPAGLVGTTTRKKDNPTGTVIVSMRKNGTEFGTVSIAVDGTVTLASASGASFNGTTDEYSVVGPATADATLTDLGIMAKAWR